MVKFRRGGGQPASSGGENDSPSRTSAGGGSMDEVDLGWGAGLGALGGDSPLRKGFGSFDEQAEASARGECEDEFSVEQAVEAIGFGWFQLKISGLTGFCWMADAMEMMILSILSPILRCEWHLSSWEEALITTVVFIGMFLSSTVWGMICDKFGRRTGLIISGCWIFYFGIVSSFSPTYGWILMMRGMVGIGVGGVPQAVTLYSEFLPSKVRGLCVTCIEIFWALGTILEVCLALVVVPTLGWQYLLIFSAIPMLIFILMCKWLPESARYQVACGNQSKAHEILKSVALSNNKPMPLGKLKCEDTQKRGSYQDLFSSRELGITTALLLFIWFANAFSYYGLVLLSTELFAYGDSCSGFGKSDTGDDFNCFDECKTLTKGDYVSLLWTTMAEFPGLIITFIFIEVLGRKKTMAIEFACFSVFAFLLFLCTTRTVLTIFLFVARAFISGGFQATYVYTPEVYPTAMRAVGLGSCSAAARIGAIITPFVAQVLLPISKNLTVGVYGAVCLVAALACLLLPIETKGRAMQSSANSQSS
ncbi:synaptic vesicle 2-related protein-like [Diadema setosum]|uniref:synaptic vesicle 2-related protein-like n=1 Tax=Diadema setosum TaxID=31175 RepID=UPI003B3BD22A